MAAAAILNFGKMSITLDWIQISCNKLYGKVHGGAENAGQDIAGQDNDGQTGRA